MVFSKSGILDAQLHRLILELNRTTMDNKTLIQEIELSILGLRFKLTPLVKAERDTNHLIQ